MNTGREIGQSSIQKDSIYRAWNAVHGGVYLPITDETSPNPYLSHIPDRDINTIKGKKFTLMNPAYMTRQVHVLEQELFGLRGHITSLNPIRAENKPDQWEIKALLQFEDGTKKVSELVTTENQPFMRVMTPMQTREFCLKCHAGQGYKLGDIRGGISVSVPMQEIIVHTKQHIFRKHLKL